ncbi:unnamed protein product [Amoebophrya sp. A120]|nr:unnamed protein product [Amoebophrya sp. A120]|eukprot:GSA120T00014083001.1
MAPPKSRFSFVCALVFGTTEFLAKLQATAPRRPYSTPAFSRHNNRSKAEKEAFPDSVSFFYKANGGAVGDTSLFSGAGAAPGHQLNEVVKDKLDEDHSPLLPLRIVPSTLPVTKVLEILNADFAFKKNQEVKEFRFVWFPYDLLALTDKRFQKFASNYELATFSVPEDLEFTSGAGDRNTNSISTTTTIASVAASLHKQFLRKKPEHEQLFDAKPPSLRQVFARVEVVFQPVVPIVLTVENAGVAGNRTMKSSRNSSCNTRTFKVNPWVKTRDVLDELDNFSRLGNRGLGFGSVLEPIEVVPLHNLSKTAGADSTSCASAEQEEKQLQGHDQENAYYVSKFSFQYREPEFGSTQFATWDRERDLIQHYSETYDMQGLSLFLWNQIDKEIEMKPGMKKVRENMVVTMVAETRKPAGVSLLPTVDAPCSSTATDPAVVPVPVIISSSRRGRSVPAGHQGNNKATVGKQDTVVSDPTFLPKIPLQDSGDHHPRQKETLSVAEAVELFSSYTMPAIAGSHRGQGAVHGDVAVPEITVGGPRPPLPAFGVVAGAELCGNSSASSAACSSEGGASNYADSNASNVTAFSFKGRKDVQPSGRAGSAEGTKQITKRTTLRDRTHLPNLTISTSKAVVAPGPAGGRSSKDEKTSEHVDLEPPATPRSSTSTESSRSYWEKSSPKQSWLDKAKQARLAEEGKCDDLDNLHEMQKCFEDQKRKNYAQAAVALREEVAKGFSPSVAGAPADIEVLPAFPVDDVPAFPVLGDMSSGTPAPGPGVTVQAATAAASSQDDQSHQPDQQEDASSSDSSTPPGRMTLSEMSRVLGIRRAAGPVSATTERNVSSSDSSFTPPARMTLRDASRIILGENQNSLAAKATPRAAIVGREIYSTAARGVSSSDISSSNGAALAKKSVSDLARELHRAQRTERPLNFESFVKGQRNLSNDSSRTRSASASGAASKDRVVAAGSRSSAAGRRFGWPSTLPSSRSSSSSTNCMSRRGSVQRRGTDGSQQVVQQVAAGAQPACRSSVAAPSAPVVAAPAQAPVVTATSAVDRRVSSPSSSSSSGDSFLPVRRIQRPASPLRLAAAVGIVPAQVGAKDVDSTSAKEKILSPNSRKLAYFQKIVDDAVDARDLSSSSDEISARRRAARRRGPEATSRSLPHAGATSNTSGGTASRRKRTPLQYSPPSPPRDVSGGCNSRRNRSRAPAAARAGGREHAKNYTGSCFFPTAGAHGTVEMEGKFKGTFTGRLRFDAASTSGAQEDGVSCSEESEGSWLSVSARPGASSGASSSS